MNVLNTISRNEDLFLTVPREQLLKGSLHIISPKKQFSDWSKENHLASYSFMQQVAQAWKSSFFTDQYLIYGKIDSNSFHWEITPYQKCYTYIGRVVQQLQVLWRTVFSGIAISEEIAQKQQEHYSSLLKPFSNTKEISEEPTKSNDSFCQDTTIKRQWVIQGKTVNVLFNYAPIGFGGERLHFLVVPKQHRETFTEVSGQEYCESLELTSKLVDHFKESRKSIKTVYLLNKTGIDAGQTVKHWHLHIIFSTNTAQDFWGKVTVFKNILLGSSPMKKEDLEQRVTTLRNELASLSK